MLWKFPEMGELVRESMGVGDIIPVHSRDEFRIRHPEQLVETTHDASVLGLVMQDDSRILTAERFRYAEAAVGGAVIQKQEPKFRMALVEKGMYRIRQCSLIVVKR